MSGEGKELMYQVEEKVYGRLIGMIQSSGAPGQMQRMWSDRAMSALNEVELALQAIDGLEREVRDYADSPQWRS